jgi:hypothetical protein
LAFTSGDCASAIAIRAHATTSTISMIAPTSLRRRMGMASLNCGSARYMVRIAAGNPVIA